MSEEKQASYGKEVDGLLALPAEEFTRKMAAYIWRTTPPGQRNGVSLEEFVQWTLDNPLAGLKYYQAGHEPSFQGISRSAK